MSDNKNVLIEVRDLCKGIKRNINNDFAGRGCCNYRTVGMRKIYVSALHESSGKTNLRFHSF